jgi:hypothetical protein
MRRRDLDTQALKEAISGDTAAREATATPRRHKLGDGPSRAGRAGRRISCGA